MVNKYYEFINEKLILESDIVFSDKFRTVLNKIEHPISKQLLDIENKDLDTKNNFFDLEFDKNDKISFIPDAKAQKFLSTEDRFFRFIGNNGGWLKHKETNQHLFDKLNYDYETSETPYAPSSIEQGKEISRVTSESSGKTYVYVEFENGKGVYNINKLREVVDDGINKVWSKNRQEIKVGKGIRAILKSADIEIEPKDLETFVNSFKALVDKMNDKFSFFEEVKGEDISYWYKWSNYLERKGTLGTSCMSNVPSEYFDIYVKNPETCSLLIFKSPDDETKILGRSLLWTLKDGKRYLDRIYTINDSDVKLFREYAKENGWYAKSNNGSRESPYAISPDGEEVSLDITVDVESGEYDAYPYLDTLKYYYPSEGTLSIYNSSDAYTLESVDGNAINCEYCEGSGAVTCSSCDGYGEQNCHRCDSSGEIYCSDCDGDGEVECDSCDGEGTIENDEGEEEECSDCSGSGEVECEECSGRGEVECEECYGRGEYECEECWGRGEVDCYECS